MGQLEDCELKLEKLSQVVAKVEEKEDSYDGAYIQDGAIKLTRGNKIAEVALPRNTEELRYRMKLIATAWEMVRLQTPPSTRLSSFCHRSLGRRTILSLSWARM